MPVVEEADVDVWSVAALPWEFPRLVVTDFVFDGVHLHQLHYSTIRRAVEDAVMTAALRPPAGPTVICHVLPPPLDSSATCRCCGRSGGGSRRTDGGDDGRTGGRGPEAERLQRVAAPALAGDDLRHLLRRASAGEAEMDRDAV